MMEPVVSNDTAKRCPVPVYFQPEAEDVFLSRSPKYTIFIIHGPKLRLKTYSSVSITIWNSKFINIQQIQDPVNCQILIFPVGFQRLANTKWRMTSKFLTAHTCL